MLRPIMVIPMTQRTKKVTDSVAWIADGALSGEPVMVICGNVDEAQKLAARVRERGVEANAEVTSAGFWVVKAKPCRISAAG